MSKEKLICPVRRLDKPGIDVDIKKGRDNLLNIDAKIKVKDPISFIINYINKKKNK